MLSPPPVVIGDWDEHSEPIKLPDGVEVLKGISVSAGVVRGPARVFLSVDSEEEVLPGEILVAPFTDPGWTPYFIPAAGIVMDMGGMLSHGSIIAREYGIPAVVNVGPATRIITTGQLVEVDGDRGEVRILDSE
ncbi:MAG: PEP-utilizing enzyme [Coriobacteriia bacterium]|nr:PEP-utilizing enzyme [Coriobacteriia bacterium]